MHKHTHISHACADSHTVDSPSCAGVINDFLWLASTGLSTVGPLFVGRTPPGRSSALPFLLEASFRKKDSFWVNSSPEEQEVLAAGVEREEGVCFMTQYVST